MTISVPQRADNGVHRLAGDEQHAPLREFATGRVTHRVVTEVDRTVYSAKEGRFGQLTSLKGRT